jgi:pilus assembly protein CpaB
MRPKSLLLLALALGCGLVASIGISQVMDRNGHSEAKIETVPIYVALHNINLGDPIDVGKMLSLQEWPKDKVPHGAISKSEDLQGRRPRAAIIEGEPILEGKLLDKGQIADPIRSITKGMRLYTIKVDAEKSAAGLLGPGDRVDVQLFVRKDQRTGVETAKSKVILQNVRVFAVDQLVQRAAEGGEERSVAKTISLLLKPEQASKLSLAAQIGEISLIPRNPDDEEAAATPETTVDDLLTSGEINSRAKEQGLPKASTDDHNATSGLLNSVRRSAWKSSRPRASAKCYSTLKRADPFARLTMRVARQSIRHRPARRLLPIPHQPPRPRQPRQQRHRRPLPKKCLKSFPLNSTNLTNVRLSLCNMSSSSSEPTTKTTQSHGSQGA